MRISDWSSDVCSSDLQYDPEGRGPAPQRIGGRAAIHRLEEQRNRNRERTGGPCDGKPGTQVPVPEHEQQRARAGDCGKDEGRSEEHTSELQSLMRISYAVFCLKKKNKHTNTHETNDTTLTTN